MLPVVSGLFTALTSTVLGFTFPFPRLRLAFVTLSRRNFVFLPAIVCALCCAVCGARGQVLNGLLPQVTSICHPLRSACTKDEDQAGTTTSKVTVFCRFCRFHVLRRLRFNHPDFVVVVFLGVPVKACGEGGCQNGTHEVANRCLCFCGCLVCFVVFRGS